MSREDYLIRRIEMIEKDLDHLKTFVSVGKRKAESLRGVWAGLNTSDQDIEEAKRSLFKGLEIDGSD